MQAILSRLSAFRASDGLDAGSPWAHRTYARAGTLHPPAHPPGRVARPDLARPAGTRRTLDVKKLSQLAPSCRGQHGEVTSKLVRIEDIPDRGLKTRQLPRELRASLCRRSEVHQFLAEKVIQRTLHPKMPLDSPRCPALLYPDLMKPHAHHYTVGLPWTPNASRQGCYEFVSTTERSLHVPPLTLTNLHLPPLPPYSPEFNPVEHVWNHLRENYMGNRVFSSLDDVVNQLCAGLHYYLHQHHGIVHPMTCFDRFNTLSLRAN